MVVTKRLNKIASKFLLLIGIRNIKVNGAYFRMPAPKNFGIINSKRFFIISYSAPGVFKGNV
jgi:hypothetical protein